MRITRLYTPNSLQLNKEVELDERGQRYLGSVLRLKQGDKFAVFNPDDGEWLATIVSLSKKQAVIRCLHQQVSAATSSLHSHLIQGIAKNDHMDLALQKAVELGIHCIQPVFCEHGQPPLKGERLAKKLQHWQGVIISACEQSGRIDIPQLLAPLAFTSLLDNTLDAELNVDLKLILQPASKQTFNDLPSSVNSFAYAIGPEGGFSQTEVELALKQGWTGIALGPRILRTETAAMAVLSVAQARWGDW